LPKHLVRIVSPCTQVSLFACKRCYAAFVLNSARKKKKKKEKEEKKEEEGAGMR
jgi:GTP cyclohydrolase II